MRWKKLILALSFAVVSVGVAPVAFAADSRTLEYDFKVPVSEASCSALTKQLGLGHIAKHPATDCYLEVQGGKLIRHGVAAYCGASARGFWRSMRMVDILTVGRVNVNWGACYNGSSIWTDWGPNCQISTYVPNLTGVQDWCGIYSGSGYADAGINFHTLTWYPFVGWCCPSYGYMRYRVYANGNSSGNWGGWDSGSLQN
jgi:hypothetical protein